MFVSKLSQHQVKCRRTFYVLDIILHLIGQIHRQRHYIQ